LQQPTKRPTHIARSDAIFTFSVRSSIKKTHKTTRGFTEKPYLTIFNRIPSLFTRSYKPIIDAVALSDPSTVFSGIDN